MRRMTLIKSGIFFSLTFSMVFAAVQVESISSAGILDSQTPQVAVLTPNGGEVYQIGDAVNITWTAVDSSFGAKPIKIAYSTNNGANYTELASNLANSGLYAWTIPNAPSLEVLVKVVAADSFGLEGFDVSDKVFKIDGPPQAPQNLALTLVDHAISLAWSASAEGDVNRYVIYRSTSPNVTVQSSNVLDTVWTPGVSYLDSAVVQGSTYYYVVTALDSMNNQSVKSNEVNGTAYVLEILVVSFKQRTDGSKIVDISYGFTGNPSGKYTITPYVRMDAQSQWVACQQVSGDSGTNVSPGQNKAIIWNFGTQMGEVYSSKAQIKIHALEQAQ